MHNVEGCAAGTEPQAWRAGLMNEITYVGLDVHKATVCVAIAESGRGGELREVGVFENRPDVLRKWWLGLASIGVASISATKPVLADMDFTDC
jgi:hypothetical protein